jgi:hypothetical protein
MTTPLLNVLPLNYFMTAPTCLMKRRMGGNVLLRGARIQARAAEEDADGSPRLEDHLPPVGRQLPLLQALPLQAAPSRYKAIRAHL